MLFIIVSKSVTFFLFCSQRLYCSLRKYILYSLFFSIFTFHKSWHNLFLSSSSRSYIRTVYKQHFTKLFSCHATVKYAILLIKGFLTMVIIIFAVSAGGSMALNCPVSGKLSLKSKEFLNKVNDVKRQRQVGNHYVDESLKVVVMLSFFIQQTCYNMFAVQRAD